MIAESPLNVKYFVFAFIEIAALPKAPGRGARPTTLLQAKQGMPGTAESIAFANVPCPRGPQGRSGAAVGAGSVDLDRRSRATPYPAAGQRTPAHTYRPMGFASVARSSRQAAKGKWWPVGGPARRPVPKGPSAKARARIGHPAFSRTRKMPRFDFRRSRTKPPFPQPHVRKRP